MIRLLYALFALVAYAVFLLTFLYLIAFVGDLPWVARTVNRGPEAALGVAVAIDMFLIALFGLQHSVMARREFKAMWTRIVPPPIERSAYVLFASSALIIMFLFWRPINSVVWSVENPLAGGLIWALFAGGWLIVLLSTYLISHFELFGLKQVWLHWRGRAAQPPRFRQPLFYKLVRHPLYSGFFIAFWATPVMTTGHLLLAAGMSVYMLLAIRLEERDLVDLFGDDYRDYRRRVGMLTPRVRRAGDPVPAAQR